MFGERLPNTSATKVIAKPEKIAEKQICLAVDRKKSSVQEISSKFKNIADIQPVFNGTPSMKYTMSPEHPSLIRSATWMEVNFTSYLML